MHETDPDEPLSFAEFPVAGAAEWRAAAEATLGGKPFDKLITPTYEGIALQPIYRREDAAGLAFADTLPGQPPYVRGRAAAGHTRHGWAIAQEHSDADPAAFNRGLIAALEAGQTAATIRLDAATRAGQDAAGDGDGLALTTAADVAAALRGVYLQGLPLLVDCGPSALPLLALLAAALPAAAAQGRGDLADLSGAIAADPLGALAETGALPLPLDAAYDAMAAVARWAAGAAPRLSTVAVRVGPYHEAGAGAVQELAIALATGVAYWRAMTARGLDADTAAGAMAFDFAIGGQFFMEAAKLRAFRLLWAQVTDAFGATGAPPLHAHTALRNKSALDPHVNMLRATTEALAAAVGGADSLCVVPFDAPARAPDDFSRRIARNVQIILQDEAHLKRLIDPAGGSYAVERLTAELARAAWALFQDIERRGGLAATLADGWLQAAVAAVAERRAAALAKRRDVMIGVNQFANPAERPLPPPEPAPPPPAARPAGRRAARATDPAPALQQLAQATPQTLVAAAIAAAAAGATLGEIAAAGRPSAAPGEPETMAVSALSPRRLAAPFEALRGAARAYADRHGGPPRLFLANLGPPRQHKARADFAQGFFEVGGFQVLTNNGFATPDAAAAAAVASGAPALVICSSDETYPDLVPPLLAAVRAAAPRTVVVLAGRPAEQLEAHKAAGVEEFIYLGADALALNRWLLEKIDA